MKTFFFVIFIVAMSCTKLVGCGKGLRWNKRSKDFEVILNPTSTETAIATVSSKHEQPQIRNFHGQPLKIIHYEDRGIFEFYDNNTKARGICGEIWTTMCSFLNFTMVLSKDALPFIGTVYENGTFTGILEKAWLNETDVVPHLGMYLTRFKAVEFGTVFWMYSVRIYSRGQWKRNPAWMFKIFAQDVWTTILAFLVTLSLANIVVQKILIRYRDENFEADGILYHLFHNFATLCNQPSSSSEKAGCRSNLLNVIIVIFAYLTLAAYNSRLIFSLAQESFAAPFTDIDTLMDKTKYHVVVLNGTIAQRIVQSNFGKEIFGRMRKSPRFHLVKNISELYARVCNYPEKYVFLETDDIFALRGSGECDVVPVGQAYTSTAVAAGFSHGFQFSKTINYWLVKFREFGLLDAMKKRYMAPPRKRLMVRHTHSLTIDMSRVSLIFCVLGLGVIASIIICIAENIIFRLKTQRTVKLSNQMLMRVKKRNVALENVRNPLQGRYGRTVFVPVGVTPAGYTELKRLSQRDLEYFVK